MLFQLGVTRKAPPTYPSVLPYEVVRELQVVPVWNDLKAAPVPLATVTLPVQASLGGGGVAIAKGKIYAPTGSGIVVIAVRPGSNASPPKTQGNEIFAGPYPQPMAPNAGSLPRVDPAAPYPLMLDKELQKLGQYRD
jgi:hypothetical protein